MVIMLCTHTIVSQKFIFLCFCCRDCRDRLGTALGTAVFYIGTVGTTLVRSPKSTLLKRSLRSLRKIQRSLERSLGGPYGPYKNRQKNSSFKKVALRTVNENRTYIHVGMYM